MLNFTQLVSVKFQGIVVVFGRSTSDPSSDIYYNVLGLDVEVNDENLSWSGFSKLEIPSEVRQVGMSIVDFKTQASTLVPSTQPFRVVSDQEYISLVQQSAQGTLYVNRFRLLETRSGTNQKTSTWTLSPAWEVRYSRSHKEDVPADKADTQEYLDPDGQPFLEPSLELSMIGQVSHGGFDVVLLPSSGSNQFAWQFMTTNSAGTGINLFNFPASDNGLFDVSAKTMNAAGQIPPDSTFSITNTEGGSPLTIQYPPRAALYVKHEKVIQPDGSSIGVKRASRVLIAIPVSLNGQTITATIDTAIGTSGQMALLTGTIVTSDIVPAPADLVFNGVDYLALLGPSTGSNPLAIAGPYTIAFMMNPLSLGDDVLLIGDDGSTAPSSAAPWVRMVDSDKLEVGFGNGTAAVSAKTVHQVLVSGVWSAVQITYTGPGDNPFTLSINGSDIPLTACTTATNPTGTPISRVSLPQNGYRGALNNIVVTSNGSKVLDLACDTVNYGVTPPTTPDTSGHNLTAQVYGPKLEPSSSPVNENMSGNFYIDANGLTWYAALANFIQPQSSTCLIDGSDGLLHLYFQGSQNQLSVAQCSTQSARATFYTGWTTDWGNGQSRAMRSAPQTTTAAMFRGEPAHAWTQTGPRLLTSSSNAQTGFLNFVANRVGTYMNATRITVSASTVSSLLCNIEVDAGTEVGKETWMGLPRDINQLSVIWNGAGGNNPDDQDVINQSTPYFDYLGNNPSVFAATSNASSGGYFLFTSVPFLPLKLAALTIEIHGDNTATLTLENTAPPAWGVSNPLVQVWPNMPATPQGVRDVLNGKAQHYDYNTVTTPGSTAWGLLAATSKSDDQVSNLSVFVRDTLTNFSLQIQSGSASHLCNVQISGFTLADVPRTQNEFASTLNGTNTTYTYPANYVNTIPPSVYVLTNGLSAEVQNHDGPLQAAGPLAYAGLFRPLYIGSQYDEGNLAALTKTTASILQSAVFSVKGQNTPLTRSSLFSALAVSTPTNGGTGRIENTAEFSNGIAAILEPGINGGWMEPPPRFCLGFNQSNANNYVQFNVSRTFTPSNELAIAGDLTVEAWLNQNTSGASNNTRAINYNVTGNFDYPNEPFQYMAGSTQGPAMLADTSTFVQGSFNFAPPNLTVQVYIKVGSNVSGRMLTVSEVRGSTEFISLNLNTAGKIEANFLSKTAVITSTSSVSPKTWTCITLTVSDAGSNNVNLSLYLNAAAPQNSTQANTFTGKLGALTVGSQGGRGLKMAANGVAFWQRALNTTQVQNSVTFGFPDNDTLLGIRWNLTEGNGTTVMNAAATGPAYNAQIINPPSPAWDANGAFYVPYMGRNNYILISNRILKNWTHIALASQQGRALKLTGSNYGEITSADAFNPGASFALEAWIQPTVTNSKQVLLEKTGSYCLYINTQSQVCLDVITRQDGNLQDDPPIIQTYSLNTSISSGQTTYIVANFTTGANGSDQGSQSYVQQTYYLTLNLYINGTLVNTFNKKDFSKSVTPDNEDSSFLLGISGDKTFAYQGLISHVRVWSKTLSTAEIAATWGLHLDPINTDGLVAGWNFTETSGKVAAGITGNTDMQLTSNQLWALWQDVSQGQIYVNGLTSLCRRAQPADFGGYGNATQLTLGGFMNTTGLSNPYKGQLEDVRLFSTLLTAQQVRESMNKPLTGSEDHLAACWAIDAGSGNIVFDLRGLGNNGTLMPANNPPVWQASSAPIKNEGQSVRNVLDNAPDPFIALISGEPSVIEYASAEKDAYGNIYSVQKRGYFFLSDTNETVLETGYKVGDLDTLYLGQVQSQPSIVGYIEGGPPIPSENQTLAYWSGDMGGPAKLYETVSTVTYVESETKSWTFKANQSRAFTGAFNIKGGFYQKSKTSVSVGLGAESETQVLENKIKIGAKNTESGDIGSTDGVTQIHSGTVSLSNTLAPAGTWEPANAILNPSVGRRYIQNNIGSAVVKSSTADLFMLALKGTQTPVGYAMSPSKNIPADTNIINFPINPKYVKNGTLDGKVGLVNDPDYPNANSERGSYFKPVEAYALKRQIEKEEQQLAAYYDQFDANKYRVLNSLGNVKDKLSSNPAYDFSSKTNRRSLYNNYVWTAAGGLHREEHSVANSYTEEYVGNSSFKFALGAEINADLGTPFGGYYVEADAMLGGSWSMTASKAFATSNAFNLVCTVTPTGFLQAPKMSTTATGDLKFDGYNTTAAPGKVDGYRYMAFFLAPSAANFTALNQVIDQNWLQNSTSAAAAALRTAVAAENGTWRILYRTTYVSRIPASFQPVKDDTNAPNITPPANVSSNTWLIHVIDSHITPTFPTPLEIGTAIDTVLGTGAQPGQLKDLIVWWNSFYTAAQVYGSTEFLELASLRVDLLNYMVSLYESKKYLSQ